MICGLGAGKTFSGCLESIRTVFQYPKSSGVIVASTYRNLEDFVLPMIQEELWDTLGMPGGWDEHFTMNKQSMVATCKNGSRIYFRSCERPKDLRGPNLGWFYIDEASKVSQTVWNIMIGRLRKPPEKGWITTTPKGRNWIWEEFARRPRNNFQFWTGATDENSHLTRDYINSLKESYSGSFLAQEFYGEFVGWEGLVYPGIKLETHHAPAEEAIGDYSIAGVDWGWTDPNVIVVGKVNEGRIHQVDEFYKPKVHIDDLIEVAQDFKSKYNIRTFFCDSSRPEYLQAFRNAGLDARKGHKEIDPGIATVNRMIDRGLFRIDFNACPNTVNEFEQYAYEEDDFGKIRKDRPIDRNNHAMDALRYMLYSQTKVGTASCSMRGAR